MRFPRTLGPAVALTGAVGVLAGCAYEPSGPYMSAPGVWAPSSQAPTVYMYEDAPLVQPEAVFIDVAPPPLLVEVRTPRPSFDAVWIGGYWGWQSRWVWRSGRWAPPPRPGYVWTHPYYENRGGGTVFVPGFWRGPNVGFVPPAPRAPRVTVRDPVVPPAPAGRPVWRGDRANDRDNTGVSEAPAPHPGRRWGAGIFRRGEPQPQTQPQPRPPVAPSDVRGTRGPAFHPRPAAAPSPGAQPAPQGMTAGGEDPRRAPVADRRERDPDRRHPGWGGRKKENE